jgi:RNA polymerase sigma-70 factor (ECF subfamily)
LCEPAIVNGAVGVVARGRAGVFAVVGVTVADDRITELNLILDPDELARIDAP